MDSINADAIGKGLMAERLRTPESSGTLKLGRRHKNRDDYQN